MNRRVTRFWSLLVIFLLPLGASAQTTLYWPGGNGTWDTTTSQWSGTAAGTAPFQAWSNGTSDTATFGLTASTVTVGTGVNVGTLTFTTDGYTIAGNTLTFGSTGTINTGNGTQTISAPLAGGASSFNKSGSGTLVLTGASTLTSEFDVSGGTLAVRGSSASLNLGTTNAAALRIGYGAPGSLLIDSGGTVAAKFAFIGSNDTSGNTGAGHLTVDGTGSSLTLTSSLNTSYPGSSITITNGGKVVDAGSSLSSADNSTTTISVSGANSVWYTKGLRLAIGANTTGSLTIDNGAVVHSAGTGINFSGGTGSVTSLTITGAGSMLTGGLPTDTTPKTVSLLAGIAGTSTILISDGGKINGSGGSIGFSNAGGGSVTITGAGSAWLMTSNFSTDGASTVSIADGGVMTSAGSLIANGTGTTTMTVGGNGASWTDTSTVVLGYSGTGTLNLNPGGSVTTAGFLRLGQNSTAHGNIVQTGGTLDIGTYLSFNLGSNSYSLQGGTLKVGDTAASSTGILATGTYTFELGNATVQAKGASLTSNAKATLLNNTVTTFSTPDSAAQNMIWTSVISGSGGLLKTGPGTLFLNATTNTYSGGTTIQQGAVNPFKAGSLGTGAVTFSGNSALQITGGSISIANGVTINPAITATMDIATGNVLTLTGVIGGDGGILKTSPGTLALSGANTYTGPTEIRDGAVRPVNAGALATTNVRLNGGVLEVPVGYVGTLANGTGAGQLQWTGSGGFSVSGGSGSIAYAGGAGLAWGSANFVPDGSAFILSSTASTGTTTFPNAIDLGGAVRTVQVNNGTAAIDATLGGGLSNGGLNKTGAGTLSLGGTNTYTGDTTISGGLINFSSMGSFGGGTINLAGGGLQWATGTTTDVTASAQFNRTLGAGGGVFDTNGNAVAFANALSGVGGLTKLGTGTLTLSAANTYQGTTTVSAGTLRATTSAGALGAGTLNLAGGTLELANDTNLAFGSPVTVSTGASSTTNVTLDRLTPGAGVTYTLGAATLGTGTAATTQVLALAKGANVTSGTAGLVLGNATLSSDISFRPAAGTALTLGSITGTDAYVDIAGAGNVTILGSIATTSGQLSKSGTGTLTLSGSNSYTGTTSSGSVGTSITGGTVRATTSASALGAGTLKMTAGTLELANDTGLNFGRNTTFTGSTGITVTSDVLTSAAPGVTHTLGTLSIAGETLTVGRGANVGSGTAGLTFGAVTLTGNATFAPAAGTLLTLASVGGNTRNFTVNGAGDVFIPGAVATTTGTIAKSGAGTLTLAGANTYTGTTTISGGTLQFAKETSLYNNATSNWTAAKLIVNSGSTAAFNVGGTGEFTAADIATLSGLGTASGGFKAGSSLGLDTTNAGGNFSYSTAIGNPGGNALSLVKLGSGTLTLSGTNAYSGGTTLSGGTLSVANNAALGAATGQVIFNGGTLLATGDFTAQRATTLGAGGGTFNVATDKTLTWNGVITGGVGNNLTKIGGGTLVLGNTAFDSVNGVDPANTYSGLTVVSAGTLTIGSPHALSPNTTLQVAPGAHFNAGSFGQTFSNLTGTGEVSTGTGGATVAPSGINTFDGTLSGTGGLTMNGTGTLILNAANPNSFGPVTVSQGKLQLGTDGALPTGTPVLLSGSATLDLNNHAATVGKLDGTGGTVALNGANLTINQTDNTAFAGVLSGDGGLTKSGTGTLILTGVSTFAGASEVTGGTLSINGSAVSASFTVSGGKIGGNGTVGPLTITSSGTLAPGNSPGLLTIVGDLSLSGHTEMELAGLSRGVSYDATNVTGTGAGNIVFGGTLDVILLSGFQPVSGNTFDLFNWTGSASGTFANMNLPSLTAGLSWDTTNLYSTGELGITGTAISAIPEPSTYALLVGFATLGLAVWRRRAVARGV